MRYIYAILISLFAFSSCRNKPTRAVLDSVDSFIQERPDSALAVLRSIPQSRLSTKKLRAHYSLLHAIALDKNYIDTTDLAIILPASEYYSRKGSPTERMKAYYYHGGIYANKGEDDRAMYYYLLALKDSLLVDDARIKELTNSAISVVYSRNHNNEQELQYALDALRYGKRAGDSVGIWAISGHVASCLGNLRRFDDAEKAYSDFFSMPVYDSLTYSRRRISYAKDLIRKKAPEPERCVGILEELARKYPAAMTSEAYCVYAYAHQLLGNASIANTILKQLDAVGGNTDVVRLWRYRIYRKQGQYKQAIEDLEHSVLAQDSIVLATLSQSLIRLQRDYLNAETEILKKENALEKQRKSLIVAVFLVLLGALVLLLFLRRSHYKQRLESLSSLHFETQHLLDLQNAETKSINSQLETKDAELLSLRKQFASMYRASFKTLNDLCSAYLSPIKKERKELLYDEAMRHLDIIINDKASEDKFMSLVNNSLDNIIDKLREDLPDHNERDFRFLTYIIVGFDATTVSSLTGYSVGTVYTKKNRLKSEISNLTTPHKELYLHFIT